MKHLLASFIAVMLAIPAIAQPTTGTVTLQGYLENEFKVNDSVQGQIDADIFAPIQSALSKVPDGTISIVVYGYTDKTGTVGGNDALGDRRAEQVMNNLKIRFPGANIITQTMGDNMDKRMVTVTWTVAAPGVTPVATPAPAPTSTATPTSFWKTTLPWVILVVVVIVIIAIPIFRVMRTPQPAKPQPVMQGSPAAPSPTPAPAQGPKWTAEFVSGGRICQALITPKDGGWLSPFTINGKPILFQTESTLIRKSLNGCLTQDQFKGQPEQLIAAGKFRMIGVKS